MTFTERDGRRKTGKDESRASERPARSTQHASCSGPGFTLLEVMIASGILFVCLFAILGLLANTLRNARGLQRATVDAGTVAAYFSSPTNRHEESIECGDFKELGDFSDRYRDFEWCKEFLPFGTNGLWMEIYSVRRRSTGQVESRLPTLVFDPVSKVNRPL